MRQGKKKQRKAAPANGRLVKGNFDIHEIQPLTSAQSDTFEAFEEGYNLLLHGMPGTGKTFLAIYLALNAILDGDYRKLVIVRSAVQGRDMGALPGTIQEKMSAYEAPYAGICNELFGRADAYGILKMKGAIEFLSTSFNRGINIDDSVILVDEAQNLSFQELDTIITRVGKNSRIIFSGDVKQDDLTSKRKKELSGLSSFIEILYTMDEFDEVEFTTEDIVRSGLVKSYILAKDRIGL